MGRSLRVYKISKSLSSLEIQPILPHCYQRAKLDGLFEPLIREEHPEFFEDEPIDEEGSLDIIEGDPTGQRFEDVFYFLKQTRDAQKATHALVLTILVILAGSIVTQYF